jgi:DNA-binding MarR family transcriptional regulator
LDAPGAHPLGAYECVEAWSALAATHRLVSEALAATLAARAGLSINDFEVLLALARREPQPLQLCDLSGAAPLSQAGLSRLIARLEQRGLVARVGAPRDRRGILLALTPSGRGTLQQAVAVHAKCVRAYFTDHLCDDEQRVLADVLAKVRSAGHAASEG